MVAFFAIAALCLPTWGRIQPSPFSNYQSILDRAPFGPPPAPEPDPVVVIDPQPLPEEPFIIPPGLDKIKVTLISRFNGIPAAGFTDEASNTPYYLLEGQSFDDFTLKNVDFHKATIRLGRGAYVMELPLWVNPATTNQADVASFGMPPGATPPVVVAAMAPPRTRTLSADEQNRIEALRQRREEARRQREEQRQAHAEEMAKLTPEEREQRLRDINVDIIINDSGPPLPIELNEKDMKKLHEAGFDVPGMDAQ